MITRNNNTDRLAYKNYLSPTTLCFTNPLSQTPGSHSSKPSLPNASYFSNQSELPLPFNVLAQKMELSRLFQRDANRVRPPEENVFHVAGIGFAQSCIALVVGAAGGSIFVVVGGVFGAVCCVVVAACLFLRDPAYRALSHILLFGLLLSVILIDFGAVESGAHWRGWPMCILLLDAVPYLHAPHTTAITILSLSVAWLLLFQAEISFRFGLLEAYRSRSNCIDPPCEDAVRILNCLPQIFVLFVEHCVFRRVSIRSDETTLGKGELSPIDNPIGRTKSLCEVVDLAELTDTLLRLDFDTFNAKIETATLSPSLDYVYRQVAATLLTFKPYIPDLLIEDDIKFQVPWEQKEPSQPSVREPTIDVESVADIDSVMTDQTADTVVSNARAMLKRQSGHAGIDKRRGSPATFTSTVAIVFTDIKSSTLLWEAAPDAMRRSLRLHNQIVRTLIDIHCGYEVKTIGDSFMVVFDTVSAAVLFSLHLQTKLLEAPWPQALLNVPICAPDAEGLWSGLIVRIGVNYGDVISEINTVGGRIDFFGMEVIIAARLESWCRPGTVCVSKAAFESLDLSVLEDAHYEMEGPLVLQGVEGVEGVTMVSSALRRRIGQDTALRRRTPETPVLQPGTPGLLAFSDKDAWSVDSGSRSSVQPSGGMGQHVATLAWTDFQLHHMSGEQCEVFMNAAILTVQVASDRTEGQVLSVIGSSVLVSWNTFIPMERHVDGAFNFSRLLDTAIKRSQVLKMSPCSIGMATGLVNVGKVGTNLQKYLTSVGDSVAGSMTASKMARRRRMRACYCLLNGSVRDWPRTLRSNLYLEEGDFSSEMGRSRGSTNVSAINSSCAASRRLSGNTLTNVLLDSEAPSTTPSRLSINGMQQTSSSGFNFTFFDVRMELVE